MRCNSNLRYRFTLRYKFGRTSTPVYTFLSNGVSALAKPRIANSRHPYGCIFYERLWCECDVDCPEKYLKCKIVRQGRYANLTQKDVENG